jgi:hypothetical protein
MKKLLVALVFFCALLPKAHAAGSVQVLQDTNCDNGAGTTSITCTFSSPVTPGNTILLALSNDAIGAVTCTGFTDTAAATQWNTNTKTLFFRYWENAPGVKSIRCTKGASARTSGIMAELTNVKFTGAHDVNTSSANIATSTTPSCATTGATAQANELVFVAWGISNAPTVTAGTGFTLTNGSAHANSTVTIGLQQKLTSATGTQTGGVTLGTTQTTGCIVATFKEQNGYVNQGFNGGTTADDATVGTLTWTNPTNAQAVDGVYATILKSGNTTAVTHYLKATNFGFSIPTSAVITGVAFRTFGSFKQSSGSGPSSASDSSCKLVKAGTITGTSQTTSKAMPTATGTPTDDYGTYGGPTNMWGTTLTGADVNTSTFGAVIAWSLLSVNVGGTSPTVDTITAQVDYTTITVYYFQMTRNGIVYRAQTRRSNEIVAGLSASSYQSFRPAQR